jgi:MFS family permease
VTSPYTLLLSRPGARRLVVSSIVGRLPLGLLGLSVLLLVRASTGSYGYAGLAVALGALGSAASASWAGRLVDRLGQTPVLAATGSAQAVVLVVLALAGSGHPGGGLLVALSALAGVLVPPVSGCARALWPEVTSDPGERESAYGLDAILQEVIWIIGPLLVGVIVAVASPTAAVLAVAGFVALGTTLFASSPLSRAWRGGAHERPSSGVFGEPALRRLLLSLVLFGVYIGGLEVGLPAFAQHVGAGGDVGLILAMWSAGSMIGGVAYGALRSDAPLEVRRRRIGVAAVFLAAPLLVAGSLASGLGFALLAGVAIAPIFTCQLAIVAGLAPPGAVTEAFTVANGALVLGIAGGQAIAGALVDGQGPRAAFLLSLLGAALAATVKVPDSRASRSRLASAPAAEARVGGRPSAGVAEDPQEHQEDVQDVDEHAGGDPHGVLLGALAADDLEVDRGVRADE